MHLGGFVPTQNHWCSPQSTLTRGVLAYTSTIAGTYGAWVSLGTIPDSGFEGFAFHTQCVNNGILRYTYDIAVGNVTTSPPIVKDLMSHNPFDQHGNNQTHHVPVHVPGGSEIFVRVASTTAGALAFYCFLIGYAQGFGFPGFSRMICLTNPYTNLMYGGMGTEDYFWNEFPSSANAYRAYCVMQSAESTTLDMDIITIALSTGTTVGGPDGSVRPIGIHNINSIADQVPKTLNTNFIPFSGLAGANLYSLGAKSSAASSNNYWAIYGLA